jgi:peptide/nickel transport system permease protein
VLSVVVVIMIVGSGALALSFMGSGSFSVIGGPLASQSRAATALAGSATNASLANAGPDRNIILGLPVTLNGSASIPAQGATIVNYTWKLSQRGATVATLYGEQVTFVPGKAGLISANLTIRDSSNHTSWDIALVVVNEKPKTFLQQYWLVLLIVGVVAAFVAFQLFKAVQRMSEGLPLIPKTTREKFRLSLKKLNDINRKLLSNRMGLVGSILLTAFILMAIFGPMLAPYDVHKQDSTHKFEKSSKAHWMGTDQAGVDIFSELLEGARTSIIIGIFSAVIASLLGTVVGLYAGYVGGWKDELVMRLNDIVLSIPWLVLMIVTAALLGKINLLGVILIIGLTGWSMTARMVRAQVLSIREKEFVERARSIGASDMAIIRRHVFPNTFPIVFANTILTVAMAILSEATLSYLKLRPADAVTWGKMLSYASESSAFQIGLWEWIMIPGLLIVGLVLAFTLMGYALDEILNPKLRQR